MKTYAKVIWEELGVVKEVWKIFVMDKWGIRSIEGRTRKEG
jgi:hypothetical protein